MRHVHEGHIIWLRMLLYELGYTQPTTRVYGDNAAMVQSATGNGQRKDSRYYQIRSESLKEIARSGIAHLEHIPTAYGLHGERRAQAVSYSSQISESQICGNIPPAKNAAQQLIANETSKVKAKAWNIPSSGR